MPTYAGIHPSVTFDKFEREEISIVSLLSRSFYITNADAMPIGNSFYKFVLARPSDQIRHVLNFDREIIILLSPYDSFEARSLEAFEKIETLYPLLRVERSVRFLFSRDRNIESAIERFIASNIDYPILCPFEYNNTASFMNVDRLSEALRRLFYSRDLFNNQNPLRSDQFFFGRGDLLKSVIDRHVSGESSGLFGLRRTGKTSLLNAVARAARSSKQPYVQVDCQTTNVHFKRWNELIADMAKEIANKLQVKMPKSLDFSERGAASSFSAVLNSAKNKSGSRVLIAFDEIENISPGISPTDHWRHGKDALLFWQTIRSICQGQNSPLGFVIVGVNPAIIESVHLAEYDNPLFNFVNVNYIKGFSAEDTHTMCSTLGGYMGLNFTIEASAELTRHFGGNPFLIRQAGSKIHQQNKHVKRPLQVTLGMAETAAESMEREAAVYATGMLQVLRQFYADEFELLCWLSAGKTDEFNRYISADPSAISHLEGYGIVHKDAGTYRFRVKIFSSAIRQFIREREDLMSQEQRREYISKCRNEIEQGLRRTLRSIAMMKFGRAEAAASVVSMLSKKRQAEMDNAAFEEVLSASNSKLYLSDFFGIMSELESEFSEMMEADGSALKAAVNVLNVTRSDAHANEISDQKLATFREAYALLDKGLKAALG